MSKNKNLPAVISVEENEALFFAARNAKAEANRRGAGRNYPRRGETRCTGRNGRAGGLCERDCAAGHRRRVRPRRADLAGLSSGGGDVGGHA